MTRSTAPSARTKVRRLRELARYDRSTLNAILDGVADIITVSEDEILDSMGYYFTDTHNVAEGAAAAPLAALLKKKSEFKGKRVGVILSGGNADAALFQRVLDRIST